MFDLSWGEIALIGVVALVVIGPKELPGVLRGVGQALTKLRRMASDFQYQFNQALQEAEVDKVKSSLSSVTDTMSTTTPSFNPIDYAREQIKSAVDDVKGTTTPAPATPSEPVIGPVLPDVAAQIPVPPSYSADPNSIQHAFSTPATPPTPAAVPEPTVSAAPVETVSSPDVSSEPEAAPAKPKRVRKPKE